MRCPKCGLDSREGLRFCAHCGQELTKRPQNVSPSRGAARPSARGGYLYYLFAGGGHVWASPRRRIGALGSLIVLASGFVPWSDWDRPLGAISLVVAAVGLCGLTLVWSRGKEFEAALMLIGVGCVLFGLLYLARINPGGYVILSWGGVLTIVGGGMAAWAGYQGIRKYGRAR